MNKRKNLSIRKFSLFAAIGLLFLILSNIFVKAYPNPEKTEFILIAVSQVIGNIAFGIGLIGYFLHLKHNRLLKWTSLFVGTFYILNLMAPDSVLPVVLDEFNGLDKNLVLVYTIVTEIIMIFFGLTFTKLSTIYSQWVKFCGTNTLGSWYPTHFIFAACAAWEPVVESSIAKASFDE